MGAGREAAPTQAGATGWETRPPPGISPGPRGCEKIALGRNVRRVAQHSVVHTTAWKANGDVSGPLLRSGSANPDPSEIARVCKYVLCYGRKGVERQKIQREIWRDTVLGYDERGDEWGVCAKLLNTTAARRMSAKAERMVEAGNLPLWGRTDKFRKVSLSGCRKPPIRRRNRDAYNPDRQIPKPRRRRRARLSLRVFLQVGGFPCFYRGSCAPAVPAFRRFRSRDATSARAVARGGRHQGGTR